MLRRPQPLSLNGHSQDKSLERKRLPKPIIVQGKTPRRIRNAVADALARQGRGKPANDVLIKVGNDWEGMGRRASLNVPDDLLNDLAPEENELTDGVVRPMPRRRQAKAETDTERSYLPPQMQFMTPPKVSWWKVLRRLMTWVYAILYFQVGNLRDRIRGRDSEERRAIRLRETFEGVGGTFVKIGQQMASRLDLLPQRYCEELASMLDRYPPFPAETAMAIIEKTSGRKVEEIFSVFDPEPIGSASIACVFQARLRDSGMKVAVKVRRPGIHELFETDFLTLDLLGKLAESLTLVRPGFTTYLRSEFRNTLTSELDFRREGRLGELFRRHAQKSKKRYVTAPHVYFEFSNQEVLIQEFVSGIWLWEILAAVEHGDPSALQRMKELNVDTKVVARRLIETHFWGLYTHISFHADPHPANIVVRANNELVFVDFGATGYLSKSRKIMFRRTYESFLKKDPATMAQTAIMLSEPLPPLDVNAVMKEVEGAYHNHMIAISSKGTPWYERTSASMFLASLNVMSRHNVPAIPDILMFARATLLYDTLAARLDPTINFYKQHERFAKKESKNAKRRASKALTKRLREGLQGSDYEMLEQVVDLTTDLLFRAQRLFSLPYDFAILPFMVEKWIFSIMMVIRFIIRTVIVALLGIGLVLGVSTLAQQPITFEEALQQVVRHGAFIAIVVFLFLLHIRLILFRLGDKTRSA